LVDSLGERETAVSITLTAVSSSSWRAFCSTALAVAACE
jgi:hypothetical protein